MTVDKVSAFVKKAGCPVISAVEGDDQVDGMVELDNKHHIQVSCCDFSWVVESPNGEEFTFSLPMTKLSQLLPILKAYQVTLHASVK